MGKTRSLSYSEVQIILRIYKKHYNTYFEPLKGKGVGDFSAMKVFCSYDENYNRLLKDIVNYLINKYGEELEPNSIQEIELVKVIDANPESDGRLIDHGNKIVLSERLFKKILHFDIDVLIDSAPFDTIISTIYHEIGHSSDMVNMPSMYNYVYETEDVTPVSFAVYLFLEYVAERRSSKLVNSERIYFYEQYLAGSWNVYNLNEGNDDYAFWYTAKVSIYFIINIIAENKRDYYLDKIDDELLKSFIVDLEDVLGNTYNKLPFDDITRCSDIEAVLNNYRFLFNNKYGTVGVKDY